MSQPKLADLPDDLRELVARAQQFTAIAAMWQRAVFPSDPMDAIQNGHSFLASAAQHYQAQIAKHPRFAEFWPQAAAEIDRRVRQQKMREHAELSPLVGADGQPLTLVPNIVLAKGLN